MNHYEFCEKYGQQFFDKFNIDLHIHAALSCDGDKIYQYIPYWEDNNLNSNFCALIYLITKSPPFCYEVRDTPNGWVNTQDWIIENYHKFYETIALIVGD